MKRSRRAFATGLAVAGTVVAQNASPAAAQPVRRQFVKGPGPQSSGYSLAVATQGGRMIWIAGHTAETDGNGKSLAADFEGQVRQVFANIAKTLEQVGGKLSDIVTMTVFLTDVRNHRTFTRLRHDILGDNFPASASITITALASPDAKIEIQGVAIVG